jgi:hypothetical protein
MRWERREGSKGQKSNACGVLMGKTKEKRAAGRPRNGWTDNIKTDLKETG